MGKRGGYYGTTFRRSNTQYCKFLTFKNGQYFCQIKQEPVNPKEKCISKEIPCYEDGEIVPSKVYVAKCPGYAVEGSGISIKVARLRIKKVKVDTKLVVFKDLKLLKEK